MREYRRYTDDERSSGWTLCANCGAVVPPQRGITVEWYEGAIYCNDWCSRGSQSRSRFTNQYGRGEDALRSLADKRGLGVYYGAFGFPFAVRA